MYFWKTSQLVSDLRENKVREIDFKNYYLATSIISSICLYIVSTQPRENIPALILECLAVLLVTIIGVNSAFKANGGEAGNGFIGKTISISFLLLVKVLLIAFFLGFFSETSKAFGTNKNQVEWINAIGAVAIQIWFFGRLTFHIGAANAQQAAAE